MARYLQLVRRHLEVSAVRSFSVTRDLAFSWPEQLNLGQFDQTGYGVAETVRSSSRRSVRRGIVGYCLRAFAFLGGASPVEACYFAHMCRWKPARPEVLVAFATCFPDEQRYGDFVAPGSLRVESGEVVSVLQVSGSTGRNFLEPQCRRITRWSLSGDRRFHSAVFHLFVGTTLVSLPDPL